MNPDPLAPPCPDLIPTAAMPHNPRPVQAAPVDRAEAATAICGCGLPREAPAGLRCWRPGVASFPEPGPRVTVVVPYGVAPWRCWYVRAATGGWVPFGARTGARLVVPWALVGLCADGISHPVFDADAWNAGELSGSVPVLDRVWAVAWLAGVEGGDSHAVRMEDFLRKTGVYYAACEERVEATPPYRLGSRRCQKCRSLLPVPSDTACSRSSEPVTKPRNAVEAVAQPGMVVGRG